MQLQNIVDIRNRGISKAITGTAGPQGPAGTNGQDLTGPLNIDGGKAYSFYAGMASIDSGYYNETYGGIMASIDGGRP